MSKKKESLTDQLSKLSLTFPKQLEQNLQLTKRASDNKNTGPCKDLFSHYLYFYFLTEEQAISYSNKLWDTASISSRPEGCTTCNNYHLVDPNGLKLVSKELKKYRYDSSTKLRKTLTRCTDCLSSLGQAKAIFSDLEEAQRDLENLGYEVSYPMYAYKCPYGHGIHLTKQIASGNRRHIGTVMQNKLASEIRHKNSLQNSQKPNIEGLDMKPALVSSIKSLEKNTPDVEPKYECLSCGWKNNYDDTLKCALCGSLGPYKKI